LSFEQGWCYSGSARWRQCHQPDQLPMEETLPRTISVTSGGLKLEFARDTFNDFDDIDAKLGTVLAFAGALR
jgi:hypothetical protein